MHLENFLKYKVRRQITNNIKWQHFIVLSTTLNCVPTVTSRLHRNNFYIIFKVHSSYDCPRRQCV